MGSLRRTRKHWRIKSRVNVCEVGKVKTESEEFKYEAFRRTRQLIHRITNRVGPIWVQLIPILVTNTDTDSLILPILG